MSARSKNSFRPALEALEDRFLPSTTPWAVAQAQQWQALMQNLNTTLGDAALALQRAELTMAAKIAQGYQNPKPREFIRIEIPGNVWYKTGLIVGKNTNLGQVLNGIPTKSPNGDFYVSRKAGMRDTDGYTVKFEYQIYGQWRDAKGWTTSKTADPNVEKINVPDGWNPQAVGTAYLFNIRVTLIDPKGNPVQSDAPKNPWLVRTNVGLQTNPGTLGDAGQTQAASVLAHNQTNFATELAARDQFFATLAQTAGQTNNPNASMASALAGRTLPDGPETVDTLDTFLMKATMHDWAYMSEMGGTVSSPLHPATNGMAQHLGS